MPMTGCCSVVLLPMMKMQLLSSAMSRIELVIAPLPKLVTRPVTVALCHKPRTVVDVVGPDHLPRQLVDQVVLLVRALGRGEHRERVASALGLDLRQLARDDIERRIPVDLDEPAGGLPSASLS